MTKSDIKKLLEKSKAILIGSEALEASTEDSDLDYIMLQSEVADIENLLPLRVINTRNTLTDSPSFDLDRHSGIYQYHCYDLEASTGFKIDFLLFNDVTKFRATKNAALVSKFIHHNVANLQNKDERVRTFVNLYQHFYEHPNNKLLSTPPIDTVSVKDDVYHRLHEELNYAERPYLELHTTF
jgi:hypothetical protein